MGLQSCLSRVDAAMFIHVQAEVEAVESVIPDNLSVAIYGDQEVAVHGAGSSPFDDCHEGHTRL